MNPFYRIFKSSALSLILLLLFAAAMAIATFVENDYGTATAWAVIYDSWWFELIMLGLCFGFIAHLFKYRLWQRSKWPVLLFHLGFVVILLGAGYTRYFSYGGIMRIREGASSNTIISNTKFVKALMKNGDKIQEVSFKKAFSKLTSNSFDETIEFEDGPIELSFVDYVMDASPEVITDSIHGKPVLTIVVSTGEGRNTIYLQKGEVQKFGQHGHLLGFDVDRTDLINITEREGQFYLYSPTDIEFFIMAQQQAGTIKGDTATAIGLNTLYRSGDLSFVPTSYNPSGTFKLISEAEGYKNDPTKDDALILNLTANGKSQEVNLIYQEGFLPVSNKVKLEDGRELFLSYGAKAIETPFSIFLQDFQLERYPGSESPSSYASEVIVEDGDEEMPYRIFMNNVLDYKGYRFFQASYDNDERGTVLSVNHDAIGTFVSYLGYFLMTVGMFFTFFSKSSRFSQIAKKLNKLEKNTLSVFLAIALGVSGFTQEAESHADPLLQMIQQQPVSEFQAGQFGRLFVQDLDGRIKPVNSLASELVRKVSRKNYYQYTAKGQSVKLNVDQVFLGMHMMPNVWAQLPIIKVDFEALAPFKDQLQPAENGLVSFRAFLDDEGNYLLGEDVENANKKVPSARNMFDKEVLKVDERFNILYNTFSGNYLKIFPNKLDPNNTWFSYNHNFEDFDAQDALFAQNILPEYFNDVIKGNTESALKKLDYISTYQSILAQDIIPSDGQLEAELFYNRINLNFWLFQIFFTLGITLLILAIVRVFTQTNLLVNGLWFGLILITLITFLCFTANIILRWYIAEHAPWSNGYEMLVFVAWCLGLSGMLIYKKSDFALPLAISFSGALLLVSWLDWLNPEITTLMPVLKSYWLKVHVATIVSSYAPLALSAVLGMMALILRLFAKGKRGALIKTKIKELTYLNELSMTIGLFTLSVGTFLGGVWANESWGRYWAWDPKETWALISIIIYSIVLHLRFIPKLNNSYVLNMASMLGFWSIIMTSFGVNYYLSGLHSYATGDPVPIPTFVYVVIVCQLILVVLSGMKKVKN